jgi:hypothetical protein
VPKRPPDDLMEWPKGELAKEVARLRAITREHAERPGDDPRQASTSDPIIGGSPRGRGDALLDARSAVLMDFIDVALVDMKRDEPLSMMLSLAGRINYADDRVTHAYIFGPDGAAGIVSQLVGLASRAAGAHGDPNAEAFAAEFKADLGRRMAAMD